MDRFQALSTSVLEAELEHLRSRLGLRANQKSELLREVTALAAWVFAKPSSAASFGARDPTESKSSLTPLSHDCVRRRVVPKACGSS